MVTTATLFAGTPLFPGGLTNERELAKVCPKKFQRANPWSTYALKLYFNMGSIANWKWKSINDAERRRQHACFQALLHSFYLLREDKEAVAGWMLSEMLTEVPEHVPLNEGH